jgi:hypothetical protein
VSAPKVRGRDGTFYQPRKARRAYRCDRLCGSPIPAGSEYVVASLPPGDREIGNEQWLTMRVHGQDYNDCPTYHPEARDDIREMAR